MRTSHPSKAVKGKVGIWAFVVSEEAKNINMSKPNMADAFGIIMSIIDDSECGQPVSNDMHDKWLSRAIVSMKYDLRKMFREILFFYNHPTKLMPTCLHKMELTVFTDKFDRRYNEYLLIGRLECQLQDWGFVDFEISLSSFSEFYIRIPLSASHLGVWAEHMIQTLKDDFRTIPPASAEEAVSAPEPVPENTAAIPAIVQTRKWVDLFK